MTDRRGLAEADRRYQDRIERRFAPKQSYVLIGALGGIALGVFALIVSHGLYRGAQGALLLAASELFGAIVGLDLYSTRGRWAGALDQKVLGRPVRGLRPHRLRLVVEGGG